MRPCTHNHIDSRVQNGCIKDHCHVQSCSDASLYILNLAHILNPVAEKNPRAVTISSKVCKEIQPAACGTGRDPKSGVRLDTVSYSLASTRHALLPQTSINEMQD